MRSPSLSTRAKLLTLPAIRRWIPKRPSTSHKGHYGHVLIIAGSRNYCGAPVLSTQAALRSGAGLVTLATPESAWSIAAQKLRPEAMTLPLPETAEGALSLKALRPLLRFIQDRKITAIGMGPGLSQSPQSVTLVRQLLTALPTQSSLLGVLLDADAFTAVRPDALKKLNLPILVTPHEGEMARFLKIPVSEIHKNRLKIARDFSKCYHCVCILKGHHTIITDGEISYINPTGNPGMATGGSGDVLTGVISALIPQVSGPNRLLRSACVGTYVHGLAGNLAAKQKSQISMIAGDISEFLPEAFKKL